MLIFLISCFICGAGTAWGASALEGAGVKDGRTTSSADGGGTITLAGPGSIMADTAIAEYWVNNPSHTLDTGANTITVTVTDGALSQGHFARLQVDGTLEVRAGGGVTVNKGAYLTVAGDGIINNDGMITFDGGSYDGATNGLAYLYNTGDIVVKGSGLIYLNDMSNGREQIVNEGTITFLDSRYETYGSADKFNNAGGVIQIALDHDSLSPLLGDLKKADAGTIEFTSGDVGSAGFTNTAFAAGLFKFDGYQNATADINVGTADIEFAGGGTFGADVTAKDITFKGANVVTGTLGGGAHAGNIINDGSLTFNQSAAQTLSGAISGTGALTKAGTGILTLTGTNTYSGATTVSGGTLALGGTGSLGNTSALTLYGNTRFDFSAGSSSQSLPQLNVLGGGASISTGANSLDLSGGSLNFLVPSGAASGAALLDVTGNADISGASVAVGHQSVRPGIGLGQSLTLLSATALTADQTGLTVRTANGNIYSLLVNNNQLLAVLEYIAPTTPAYKRLKAYAEGRAASLAFINQGQELLLTQGFGSALAATRGPGFRLGAFGGMGGGKSRYGTGSHVDVEGFSMLAGLALGNDVGMGRLSLGVFFEGGWGNYDSRNSFSNYASVDGDGDTSYYGGGVLGRYDLTSGFLSGLYFDASARLGRAKADFNSDDIKYNGSDADFDSASLYYGLHGGLGYVWNITEAASLDLSAKLLWTRQESDSVSVHGDRVRFKDADSLRTRLGGRFTCAVTEQFTPYAGAYWEHEFDGKVRSTVNGNGIDAPELTGDTGVGELGLSFRPFAEAGSGAASGLSFDLAVQGYTGVREGVSGSFQLKFEF